MGEKKHLPMGYTSIIKTAYPSKKWRSLEESHSSVSCTRRYWSPPSKLSQSKVCTTVVDTPDTTNSIKKRDHRAAVRAAGAASLRVMRLKANGVHISATTLSGAMVLKSNVS